MDIPKFSVAPNADQVKSFLLVAVPAITAYMVGKGYITAADAGMILSNTVAAAPFIATVLAAIWAIYRNRRSAIIDRAAAQPKTVVITDSETAAASKSNDVIDAAKMKQNIPQVTAATAIDAAPKP